MSTAHAQFFDGRDERSSRTTPTAALADSDGHPFRRTRRPRSQPKTGRRSTSETGAEARAAAGVSPRLAAVRGRLGQPDAFLRRAEVSRNRHDWRGHGRSARSARATTCTTMLPPTSPRWSRTCARLGNSPPRPAGAAGGAGVLPRGLEPVCDGQMALYNEVLPKFRRHDAELLGIAVDGVRRHLAFAESRGRVRRVSPWKRRAP